MHQSFRDGFEKTAISQALKMKATYNRAMRQDPQAVEAWAKKTPLGSSKAIEQNFKKDEGRFSKNIPVGTASHTKTKQGISAIQKGTATSKQYSNVIGDSPEAQGLLNAAKRQR